MHKIPKFDFNPESSNYFSNDLALDKLESFKQSLLNTLNDENLVSEIEQFILLKLDIDQNLLPRQYYGYFNAPTQLASLTRVKLLKILTASNLGFNFLNSTYNSDLFVDSPDKRHLVKRNFFDSDEDGYLVKGKRYRKLNRTPLNTITIEGNVLLSDFHLENFNKASALFDSQVVTADFSHIYNGKSAVEYYPPVLALSLLMPLMDSFDYPNMTESAIRFRDEVFLPAKEEVFKEFGMVPKIVTVPEISNEYYYYKALDGLRADIDQFNQDFSVFMPTLQF